MGRNPGQPELKAMNMIRLTSENNLPNRARSARPIHLLLVVIFLLILPLDHAEAASIESGCNYNTGGLYIQCNNATQIYYERDINASYLVDTKGFVTSSNFGEQLNAMNITDWQAMEFYLGLQNSIATATNIAGANSVSIAALEGSVAGLDDEIDLAEIYGVLDPDLVEQLIISGFFLVFLGWFLGYAVSLMTRFFRRVQQA